MKLLSKSKQASLSYYGILIFYFVISFLSDQMITYKNYLTSELLRDQIERRLSIESEVFKLHRSGVEKKSTNLYSFYSDEKTLVIDFLNGMPMSLEYAIMEDESYVWRRKL